MHLRQSTAETSSTHAFLIILVLAGILSGCAAFDQREVTYLRSAGVPAPILQKLERGEPLTPQEIIALAGRNVPDHFILRHLEDHGVTYLVTREDIIRMRSGGVSARVIDAVIAECELFARRYAAPAVELDSSLWWVGSSYIGREHYYDGWW